MISRTGRLALHTLAIAGLLAACDSSITQPGLNANVAFAKGGNSEAAKACQKDGYLSVQGSDGQTFKNAGECIAYVAKGGALQPIGGGGGGSPTINDVEIIGLNCTELPWTATFLVTFSGGTGTVNGYPMTSGAAVTVPQTTNGLYEFVVTNGTESASVLRAYNCT